MKVTLNNDEPLCIFCDNATDECAWIKSGGKTIPDYVKSTIKRKVRSGKREYTVYSVRDCSNFIPEDCLVKKCKRCGEEYVMQAGHTNKIDDGMCYDCHVDLKKTYRIPRPTAKFPEGTYKRVCPICNKEFVTDKPAKKYCSDECKKEGASRINRKLVKRYAASASMKKKIKKEELALEEKKLAEKAERLKRNNKREYEQAKQKLKQNYRTQKAEFKKYMEEAERKYMEEWQKKQEKALEALDKQLEESEVDADRQLSELIDQKREEILGNDNKKK